MNELTERLKSIQLNIFDIFVAICERHGLQYFALGGTALGSIRHNGFIPWDDDIDVALPREDYEKFLSLAQAELPENMFLQTYKTDENYPHCFAKIRVSDTAFIEKTASEINMNHGVYMDVFPLDGYSESTLSQKFFKIRQHILKVAQNNAFSVEGTSLSGAKRVINAFIKGMIPYKKAVKKLDRLYQKHPYSRAVTIGNFCGAWGHKEIMPKEIFGNGVDGVFEGRHIRLPEKTDEYLTRLYGDYMTPPPPEKRIAHHYCTVIDLEKSYKEYRSEETK